MRGERAPNHVRDSQRGGSSPHARGTRGAIRPQSLACRIIPACAGNATRWGVVFPRGSDHPRMRGERLMNDTSAGPSSGSSPHARGTRVAQERQRPGDRIIPACAGNAPTKRRGWASRSDHPRMRGERRREFNDLFKNHGSSPHARGTRLVRSAIQTVNRIIPACAGNAASVTACVIVTSDHPRMRGERYERQTLASRTGGSSPHARGTLGQQRRQRAYRRIIPACAGNATVPSGQTIRTTDHPRMRGERPLRLPLVRASSGSSPHARGTHETGVLRKRCRRIIPACAGNASTATQPANRTADHPRMRGERIRSTTGESVRVGSSPHARGTLANRASHVSSRRIIPACAGNARNHAMPPINGADHPRMRGERAGSTRSASRGAGSSPHARGTPPRSGVRSRPARIIPACAGNAAPRRSGATVPPDHPRMRGERCARILPTSSYCGSSPHARGTRVSADSGAVTYRIIPACAGNADPNGGWRSGAPDHPRMRGERSHAVAHGVRHVGSSPHARGTLFAGWVAVDVRRIIPACAGNADLCDLPLPPKPDHPRMRGERTGVVVATNGHRGSSPHARGTRGRLPCLPYLLRIIPACAGNAFNAARVRSPPSDHPRMRGERPSLSPAACPSGGSSPHARGTHGSRLHDDRRARIIPACAGNAAHAAKSAK